MSGFKPGDVVAFVRRVPKFRIDSVVTINGELRAEMTMIEDDRGDPVSYRQLGGPALLSGAVVLPADQFTRPDSKKGGAP